MYSKLVEDIAAASAGELNSRLRQVDERRRSLAAEEGLLLAEVERRELHAVDGHAFIWGKLRAELSWSNGGSAMRDHDGRRSRPQPGGQDRV